MSRCLEALKAEPQEMFGSPNTDPHKVFGRRGLRENKNQTDKQAQEHIEKGITCPLRITYYHHIYNETPAKKKKQKLQGD